MARAPAIAPAPPAARRAARLLLALLLCLGGSLPCRAQLMAMRHIDNRDGLPQSQVTALLEDRQGFIWVATTDGLIRLGANGFHLFDSLSGFQVKDINCLLEDHTGAIWAASPEKGIARIRGHQVTHFGRAEGLAEEDISCLLETRQGELLAGSHRGLFRRRGERFERVPLPEPWGGLPVTAMAEDGAGRLWLGSRQSQLGRWDGRRLEVQALPREPRPTAIIALQTDPSGRVWALQAERLLREADDGRLQVESLRGLPPGATFTGFSLGRKGELILLLGPDGLYLREPGAEGRLLEASTLPCKDAVVCALRDRQGSLWLGTNGDHLWTQPFPGLQSLARHPETGADLGLGTVTALLNHGRGRILLGGNNGVFLWEPGRGLTRHWTRRDGLRSLDVWALHADGRGGAWIGTTRGLQRLDASGRIEPGPSELQKTHVQFMAQQDGHLWLGTDKGLAELDAEGRFRALHDPLAATGYSGVHTLLAQAEGLLVGTSQGLYRFQAGRFTPAFTDDPSRKLQILSLLEEPGGRLWVGTSQSLLVREPGTGAWTNLGLEAGGQPLYSLTWIRRLATGMVAVGHAKGVTLVDPTGRAFHLTRRMGLISDETNQAAALEDAQGRLWIGMVGGVSILARQAALPELPQPQAVITDVTWDGGSAPMPQQALLPPGARSLAVHVDVGGPSTPFPVRIEALLEESDRVWQPLDPGTGTLRFGGLAPGTHRLHVRASHDGRNWHAAPPLLLHLRPAWYQSWWARGGMLLLLALGGVAAYRLRIGHLKRLNEDLEARIRVRTRELEGQTRELAQRNQSMEWTHRQLKETLESRMKLFNTLSHDLRSPLTSILLSVDRIQVGAEEVPAQVAKVLGVMAHEARRLDEIVKSVLDRNRAESLVDRLVLAPARPADILENLEETLTLKADDRGLRCHLYLESASLAAPLLLDVPAMRQVLFNLVENALKFTDPPGDVGVRSTLEAQAWVLEVWDSGRGIPREDADRLFNPFQQGQAPDASKGWGLGLFICRSIVLAHGGEISVDSDRGKGAIFTVRLPLAPPTA